MAIPSGGGPLAYVEDLERPVLAEEDRHHLARVRRVRAGDPMVLGDGAGGWRTARFQVDAPEPDGPIQRDDRPEPELGVAFALVKGSKPELVVQKLTELGVDRIVAFTAARSVVRWDAPKAAAAQVRLAKVAREAAMQSRRAWLPEVEPIADFAEVSGRPAACLADRGGDPLALTTPLVLIGPEGGWAEEEREAGPPRIALAGGVLRAETAAIVAGSLLVALREGLVRPA